MEGLTDTQKKSVTESMMLTFARSCLASMKILEKNEGIADWHLPFYLLATTALELFAKIVLFKKMDRAGKTLEEIETELRKHNHNLYNLYSSKVIDTGFLAKAGITKVDLIEVGGGIFRYHFYVSNKEPPIYVYDTESMKYGLMTKKENIAFVAYQTTPVLELCENTFKAMISS